MIRQRRGLACETPVYTRRRAGALMSADRFLLCPPRSTLVPDLDVRSCDRKGARTVCSCPGEVTVQWSDADDVDEIAESGEVVGISGVEREAVSVSDGCDEQVGDTPSM
jgi:hypothetical protein